MKDRPSPDLVERALVMQEGSILAREVLALREDLDALRAETERALTVLIDENEQLRGLLRKSARKTVFFRQMWRLGNEKRMELRKKLHEYRSTQTIGGPPPKVTPCWEPGDSSRPPTAPPEEIVVALPVSEEELATRPRHGWDTPGCPCGNYEASAEDCTECR